MWRLLVLLLGWAAAEESAGSVRHGVCEVNLERLQALEAELVEVIRDVDVRRVKEEHAAALRPLQPRDAQARWGDGRPDTSELFVGSSTFRGRFNLPEERPVSLDDLRANDYMGSAVAINPAGTVALFGARGRDDVGLDAGGAMIFERSFCSDKFGFSYACWTESYRMSPMVGSLGNTGQAVALSHAGDVAVVGSRGAKVGTASGAGVVTIYRDSNGLAFGGWSVEAELQSPTPAAQSFFGDAVAVHPDGSLVVIGSYGVNLAVEVMVTFDCDLNFFTQGTAECPGGCDYTPTHVETPVCELGSPAVTDATGLEYGNASYVLHSSGELARCPAGCNSSDFTSFTPTCALANGSVDRTDCATGCLFLPERVHTPVCWSELNRTSNPDIALDVIFNQTSSCPLGCNYTAINASCTGTAFNISLNATCSGMADPIVTEATCTGSAFDVLVDETCVGEATPVPLPDGTVMGAGTAFVATPGEDDWQLEELKRAQRPEVDSRFGSSVACMGKSVFVGAPGPMTSSGKVYIFRRNAATGQWEERQVLSPSEPQPDQSFGSLLSVGSEASGIVAISADTYSTRTAQYAGRVYLFRRLPAHNASVFTVVSQKGCGWDGLDYEGQYQHQGPAIGGAGVTLEDCERACGLAWTIGVECNYLSHSAVVGPPDDLRGGICRMFRTCDGESLGPFTTTFRFTTHVEDEWVEFCPLVPDYSVAFDRFGTSVAISDDSTTIAVGASYGEVAGGVVNTGEVFLYNSNQYGDFIQRKQLVPSDDAGQTPDARFGVSVALNGDATLLAVGCELAENPVNTDDECLVMGGMGQCENTGTVYMYTSQCPLLPMLNSNRDGSVESGGGKRPCFATVGMDCIFSCNSGWKGGNGSSYPYRNLNGSINHEAIRVTPPTSSPAYRASNTSIGSACQTDNCAVQRNRGRYQPLISSDNGEYRRRWDSALRQYVYINPNGMKIMWRSEDGKWCIYNEREEKLVAFTGGTASFRLQDGPPLGALQRGWMVMGWLADGEAEFVADYSLELSVVQLVDQDSFPKYNIGCRSTGSFHADWEIGTDQLCYSVPCPPNAHFTDRTATACVCDDGYGPARQPNGLLDAPRWVASDEAWTGSCVPEPCEPSYIAHSNHAEFATSGIHEQYRLPACVGNTFENCYFTCDPAYRCSVPPIPAWLATDDSPGPADDGSWDMTVPDLTRKTDPRERPVTCQGENTQVYCDRDGVFQRATCVHTPCPEFSKPVRHYCYDEDGDPILLEAFEDEDTGEPVPFDDRDTGMLAAAKEECLDDEDNRWVGDFGGEEGCECIDNYVVDREQCWAGIPPFKAPLSRVKWDLQAQNWAGKCEGEWVVESRARGCLFDAIAVVTLVLVPMAGAVFFHIKRSRRKKLEREALYRRERREMIHKEEVERFQKAAQDREQRKRRLEEEQRMLSTLSPAAAKEWWRNKEQEELEQQETHDRAKKHWVSATSVAKWRNSKVGKRKVPDKILYSWQGEVGARRGEGSLASAKILYGEAWKTMEPEEKKLILYRLDTEYSRPTSTEAWQKPMKKPGLPESPPRVGSRAGRQPSRQAVAGTGRGGGDRKGRSAKVVPTGADHNIVLGRSQGSGKRLPALRNSTGRPNNDIITDGKMVVGQRAAGFFADGENPDAWAIEDVSSP